MAGLKSPSKKKRDSSKPNTVLVVFLVFFILLSIGLGVWGYYGYADKDKLQATAKEKAKSADLAKEYEAYAMFIANEARLAIGAPGANPKDKFLDPDEATNYAAKREEFFSDNFKQKDAKYEAIKKLTETLKADLNGYDDAGKKYHTSYRELLEKYKTDSKALQAALAKANGDLKAADDKFQTLQAQQEKYWAAAMAEIKKGNTSALDGAQKKYEAMEAEFKRNTDLVKENEELKNKALESEEVWKRKVRKLTEDLDKASAARTDVAGPANGGRGGLESLHALVLDISQGKPLWDTPLGKITRVDLQARQVYINLGSANGMKPEVTFNIFGAGWNGRADKELKGTIEVIRVLDSHSSLARITSIYDPDGREIVLGDARSRPGREAENALKEGDLLYNAFWGSRVAIAGYVPFAGQASDSPAEQMRILNSFMQFLSRQGITVDAYLDLNDGTVKGAISNRTRYLIRGDDLVDPAKFSLTRKKEAAKDDDGADKKDDAAKADVLPDRLKSINEAAGKMRLEAADKGLLIISADNFLNVIGYRQPRSAVYGEVPGFRPGPISAGQPAPNPAVQAAPAPRPDDMAPEKKGPDAK